MTGEHQQESESLESRVFIEKRPTSVTVIGWTWIVIGVLMILSAAHALFGSALMFLLPPRHPPPQDRALLLLFPVLALFQIAFAFVAIKAGRHLLLLEEWARRTIAVLCRMALIGVVIFISGWIVTWTVLVPREGGMLDWGLLLFGLAIASIDGAIFIVPLVLMLRSLGSEKLRDVFLPERRGNRVF